MRKREFYYDSADGKTKIHALEWAPEGEPIGIVQIVHGMAEYVERYEALASFLTESGILVVGHDHLGHGKSVGDKHPYGYFCSKDAAGTLVEDVHRLRRLVEAERKNASLERLPYLILGHSMGSFILRNYLCVHGEGLDGAIIMGTGMQPQGLLKLSKRLVRILSALQGEKHKSGLVNMLAFGSYNKRIPHPVSPMDWLSTDASEVAKYNQDPLCGFTFTLNGFAALFELIWRLHDEDFVKRMPHELPVLFLAGKEDPVGDYGKAVEQVYRSFLSLGMEEVTMKLYENDRHELVNEADRKLVWKDIREWVCKRCGPNAR